MGLQTNKALNFFPILEEDQRRNALNPKADGYFPVFVNVDFPHKCFVFELFGNTFDDRLLEAARPTPRRIKVD